MMHLDAYMHEIINTDSDEEEVAQGPLWAEGVSSDY